MSNPRRGQPKKDYVENLQTVDKYLFRDLLKVIIPAMMEGRPNIFTRWSYLMEFPEDFPKGHIIKKDGLTDIRVMRIDKVLKWLYKHKIIDFTRSELAAKIRIESHRMRNYFKVVDVDFQTLYNDDSDVLKLVDEIKAVNKAADKDSA